MTNDTNNQIVHVIRNFGTLYIFFNLTWYPCCGSDTSYCIYKLFVFWLISDVRSMLCKFLYNLHYFVLTLFYIPKCQQPNYFNL